ncbi:MAG: zinc-dependent metalloprotease [Actinomycetaceae bacterium]|nr:zinc-dependent metalloprotease [Actinomycetaceae bacterium]
MARINPNTAQKVARWISGAGPSVSPEQARASVEQLRAQAVRAPQIVADVTGMADAAAEAAKVPVYVVDRANWARAAAQLADDVLAPHIAPDAGRAGNAVSSAEVAVGVAGFATRVLGQYDPFSQRLLLVAPNIAAFGEKYALDRRDLALWVCVHELTHAAQFAAAPWLKDYMLSRARTLLTRAEADPASFTLDSGPGGELSAIMSLLEGHAEYVMNSIALALMPGKNNLIAAMERRRSQGGPITAFVRKAAGFDAKMAQYRDGAAFVGQVVDRVGHEGLAEVWADPLNAPSPEEIAAPAAWIRRVIG